MERPPIPLEIRKKGRLYFLYALLVTDVMGQGVNLVTGDYSRGASGFWIEQGKIAWSVEEITIAGHLRDLLANIMAAGTEIDTRHNIQTASLLVDKMTVAGQS